MKSYQLKSIFLILVYAGAKVKWVRRLIFFLLFSPTDKADEKS